MIKYRCTTCGYIYDPVVAKGFPKDEDFKALEKLADEIRNKHDENNFVS